jgi:hypothetical protein
MKRGVDEVKNCMNMLPFLLDVFWFLCNKIIFEFDLGGFKIIE